MQGYLSADIIFSKMRTIFRKQSTRKIVSVDQGTDNVQGQIYRYPPFQLGMSGYVMRLDQSRANKVYPFLSNTVGNTGLALVKNGMSQPSDRVWSCKSEFRYTVSFCGCCRLPTYISSQILGPRIFENIRKWRMTNHWIGFTRTRKGKLNVDQFSCTDCLLVRRFEVCATKY